MKKTKRRFKKMTAMFLILATVIATMPVSVFAADWHLQVATALEEGKDNYAYALADYNHDGIEDLFCIKLRYCGTKTTEIHVLDGSTNFASYLLQTGTALGEAGTAFKFVVGDINNDGFVDVCAIMVRGTGSGKSELHVLNGATGYKSWLLQKALPLEQAKDNCSFALADMNGDGKLDLYVIKYNQTGSKKVEAHVLSGKSGFNEWILHTSVPLSQTNASTFRFQVGDYNGDACPDLYAIKISSTSSKRVELHILNGHNSMQTFLLQKATVLGADKSNFEFLLGDYTRNSKLELYCIKKSATGLKRTEVHVLTIDGARAEGTRKSTVWPVGGNNYTDQKNWVNYRTRADYHSGTDISASKGTPVYATYDGVVDTALDLTNSYGRHVILKCQVNGETVYIYYAHLDQRNVKKGDIVKAGQQIGTVGSTGNADGPHLHYEVRNVNKYYGYKSRPTLNPYNYLPEK